jgi:hypothetical protein
LLKGEQLFHLNQLLFAWLSVSSWMVKWALAE